MTTKQGSCEKTPFATSGNSSARPTLWSSLKHRSGLGILSTLFVSALHQRQTLGIITAESAFKPPPRVTLTEPRREAWLKDFADLAIPLRRLSRRIPHGITGKILLDQCLAKDIPITRAIWLAKCVGANEIRSIKRKGTSGPFAFGGETRWIRDWTKSVESFLESIVGDCGASMWRDRMSYRYCHVQAVSPETTANWELACCWYLIFSQSISSSKSSSLIGLLHHCRAVLFTACSFGFLLCKHSGKKSCDIGSVPGVWLRHFWEISGR